MRDLDTGVSMTVLKAELHERNLCFKKIVTEHVFGKQITLFVLFEFQTGRASLRNPRQNGENSTAFGVGTMETPRSFR